MEVTLLILSIISIQNMQIINGSDSIDFIRYFYPKYMNNQWKFALNDLSNTPPNGSLYAP